MEFNVFCFKKINSITRCCKATCKALCCHPEFQQRKDGQSLSSKLLSETEWIELDELVLLLEPFAQTTKLIGGSQYPTLGMMLPTILLLLSHLYRMNELLSSTLILDVYQSIENSISNRWETPLIEAYIASYLDPHFQNMSFTYKEKKERVQNKISKIIEVDTNINIPVQTEMDQFFDGYIQNDCLVNNVMNWSGMKKLYK